MYACACVCVCVCVYACACVCVCMCTVRVLYEHVWVGKRGEGVGGSDFRVSRGSNEHPPSLGGPVMATMTIMTIQYTEELPAETTSKIK